MKQRHGSGQGTSAQVKALTQRFAYGGLLVAAIALMMLGKADTVLVENARARVADTLTPVFDMLSRPAVTIDNFLTQVSELVALREENAHLREQNARLLSWQAVAQRLKGENRSLRRMTRLRDEKVRAFVSGRVVADTGGPFVQSILITAGRRDGVKKGQAVQAPEGLVGRVSSTGERSARVLLISDLNSHIPVVVAETGIRAIMAGDNTDRPTLIRLPVGVSLETGQRIVTSGHGGALPPGISIGVIAAIGEDSITVQPHVDRDRLTFVEAVNFETEKPKAVPDPPTAASVGE